MQEPVLCPWCGQITLYTVSGRYTSLARCANSVDCQYNNQSTEIQYTQHAYGESTEDLPIAA
jgi:hypothetical protein